MWTGADTCLLLGITELRRGDTAAAGLALGDAAWQSSYRLRRTATLYRMLDVNALALCGLVLLGETDHIGEAARLFATARRTTSAKGIVAEVLERFDIMAVADIAELLTRLRLIAAGTSGTD